MGRIIVAGVIAVVVVRLTIQSAQAETTPNGGPIRQDSHAAVRIAQVAATPKKQPAPSAPKSAPGQNGVPGNPINALDTAGPLYSELNIANPIFANRQGEWLARGGYSMSWDNSFTPSIGLRKKGSSSLAEQLIRYGLTNDISVQAILEYVPQERRSSSFSSGPSFDVRHSSGWEDPEFDVIGRVFKQPGAPLYMNVTLGYEPNAFPVKKALLPLQQDSVANGQQTFILEDSTGYKLDQYTLEVGGSMNYTTEGAGNGYSWAEDLHFEIFEVVSARWSYEVNGGLSFSPAEGSHSGGYAVGEVDYYIIPSRLQAQLTYRHDFDGDDNENMLGIKNLKVTQRREDKISLKLGYVFGSEN